MGRRPSKPGAIPRFRARKQKSGAVHYYYDMGGKPRKEKPLGRDYGLAIKQWADLEGLNANARPVAEAITFAYVADRYMIEIVPSKAQRTQEDNKTELVWLKKFFNDPPAPLEGIEPVHVRMYLNQRSAKVRGNREKALLSAIWNFARDKGYTALPNPCAGIKGNKETGRDVYLEDEDYTAIWKAGDVCLRDAMDLAYLTGQRPADVLLMDETHIRDEVLRVRQGKTQAKLQITIARSLPDLLARIRLRKSGYKVHNTRLIVNEYGRPIGVNAMSRRWKSACKAAGVDGIQFRDLRAKAGTDKAEESGDARVAQRQLGHTSLVMTEQYLRKRKGEKSTPTR